ncbi:MAG: hypothetical protein H6703_14755 [Myxococcales bacterium]|nr:hypothetical protein [Myxococcales bacterium]
MLTDEQIAALAADRESFRVERKVAIGRVTPDTFGRPGGNDYRNPTVANALKTLGFVQRFGLGVPLARKACAENGNPPPEFLFEQNTFGVVVRARSQA